MVNLDVPHDVILERIAGRLVVCFFFVLFDPVLRIEVVKGCADGFFFSSTSLLGESTTPHGISP